MIFFFNNIIIECKKKKWKKKYITTNITIRVQNGRRAQNGWLQIPKISPLFWTFGPNTFLVFP